MENFELMRYIAIGQYYPTNSSLHQLDPRTKILGVGSLLVAIVFHSSLSGLFFACLAIFGFVWLSKVPLRVVLQGLRPALPILILLAILQLFFGWGANTGDNCLVLIQVSIIKTTSCSLVNLVSMVLRLISLILLTGLLTMTSTISEITHGIEGLLRPLGLLGFPAHEIALVFSISIRFVPTLAQKLEKLLKAQASRGANIHLGSNPLKRIRHLFPVLLPLFLTTLRNSEILIEAMEARGYSGSQDRSFFNQLRLSNRDYFALLCIFILIIGFFTIPFGALDQHIIGMFLK